MTATGYLDTLLATQPQLAASPLARLNELRAEAVDRVGVLTVPTIRDEEWRFTDVTPLTRLSFQPVRTSDGLDPGVVEGFHLDEPATRFVFVDGVHAPGLSSIVPGGAIAVDLATAAHAHRDAIDQHLGRHAHFRDDVFAALNTAFLQQGALIVVPRGMTAAAPVHVLHVATRKDAASYPRCLIVAESGSVVTVIEDFVSLQDDAYFTDAVTEVSIAANARVDHIRVQREGARAFHIASCAVSLAAGSSYNSVGVTLGARISRYTLGVAQTAAGARCSIDGLAIIGERQLADTHTSIDHMMPDGVSRQRHKCIVGGAAHAVFNGKIMVRPGAQRTDSSQSSRNLLLTGKAHVDTKPQLEIFADDVKCAHGATVGQLDGDALFYLVSRGLSDAAARSLLTYAFGAEIVDRVPVASLRNRLEMTLLAETTRQP